MLAGTTPRAALRVPDTARRHWRLAAFAAAGVLPFLPSIVAMRDFLLADNALGFVPLMLPLAGFLFWVHARSDDGPAKRDVLLDVFFALPFAFAALFVLAVTPSRLSWYFWLNRVDLLALPLLAAAAGFVFLGYQQVLRAWPAFLALAFVWPWPAVRLQGLLDDPFVGATAWLAGRVSSFLHLPYAVSAADPDVFASTHLPGSENFVLVIGQVCSGTATLMGFALLGLGVALLTRGPAGSRLRWFAVGLGLAFLTNVVRVVVLLVLASKVSRGFAMDIVHPVLGLLLFAGLVVLMLWMLRFFGLRLDLRPRGRRALWEPAGGGRPLGVLYVLAAAAAVGVAALVVQVQEYAFIGVGDGAPTVDITSEERILPAVEAWSLVHLAEVSWTDLFGRSSRGDIWEYYVPGGPDPAFVTVQSIIAEDKATLDRYGIERCIDFHGRTIEARRVVAIGHGVNAVLLHETYEGVASSTLYWQMPVLVDGEVRHARIALLSDVEAPLRVERGRAAGFDGTARLGVALENAFDARRSAAGEGRDAVDRQLVTLAAGMIDAMVGGGGAPASAAAR
jgi:exosortase/archaeosortase family protein